MKRWFDTGQKIQQLRLQVHWRDSAAFGQPYLIRPLNRTSRFKKRRFFMHTR
ncbi:hypothetical protein [Paenibacillus sp. NPDC057967]|uniref:hypothetical protein n=1 Tax=Paenibacillus sp. NPDC057967 TaxID=3346293 RepID=UPI0036DEC422